jgi:hypothetical protein
MKSEVKNNMSSQILKIIAIKTKDKVYISDNIKNESYFNTRLKRYIFDGDKVVETFNKDWFELKQIPNLIQEKKSGEYINKRYELKAGYPISELTPKVIPYEDNDEFEEVMGLYERKYDTTEETLENVEFELIIVEELDDFTIIKQDFDVQYGLIDKISIRPILLPTRPCQTTIQQSYDIIRKYIREHIDSKYARITSDDEWKFTVTKDVKLYEPLEYSIDLNAGTRKRKTNYVSRLKTIKSIKLLEMSYKHDGYEKPTIFKGSNYEDLLKNINEHLANIVSEINKPYIECPCCKGDGVILEDKTNE